MYRTALILHTVNNIYFPSQKQLQSGVLCVLLVINLLPDSVF